EAFRTIDLRPMAGARDAFDPGVADPTVGWVREGGQEHRVALAPQDERGMVDGAQRGELAERSWTAERAIVVEHRSERALREGFGVARTIVVRDDHAVAAERFEQRRMAVAREQPLRHPWQLEVEDVPQPQ